MYPLPEWLVLGQKILNRGRLVPLSPNLEAACTQSDNTVADSNDLHDLALFRDRPTVRNEECDSEDEIQFINDRLPLIFGPQVLNWTLAQVHISTLTGLACDVEAKQRVDFVITWPGGPRLVVEIDGEQHTEHQAADRLRDEALRTAGFTVVRVPVAENRAGAGPAMNQLQKIANFHPAPEARPPKTHLLALQSVARLQAAILGAITSGVIDGMASSVSISVAYPATMAS